MLWNFLRVSLVALLGLVALAAAPLGLAAAERPNILFLFTDDQHADTIAALGNRQIETPHLDRLARRGLAFNNCYCMGSNQGAVCVPSRAMLLSGRTLFRAPSNLAGVPLLPEVLQRHDYVTFAAGKWHNGAASFRGFDHGRALFFGGMSDQERIPLSDRTESGQLAKRSLVKQFSTELFIDEAVRFVEGHDPQRPFFAYVAFTMPHDPRTAPDEYQAKYDPAKLSLPASFLPEHPFDNGELKIRDEQLAPWPRTPEIVRSHTADYYATITYLDAQIGRLIDSLERRKLLDNTIVIFASDHGLALGRHGLFGKQNVYEHSMRAPLIIAGPGVPQGKASAAKCYLYDLFATVCDLAGAEHPDGIDAQSLAPIIRGERAEHRDEILLAYRHLQRSLRVGDWKVIHYPVIGRTQLFDLAADPEETRDLSSAPEQAERLAELLARLEKTYAAANR